MKKRNWYLIIAAMLVALSAVLYVIDYAIFRDARHIYIYLVGDIAFLPLEVLFVSLIIDQLLSEREKRIAMEKLNMVIGAFFSEVGADLLKKFRSFDPDASAKREALKITGEWKEGKFKQTKDMLLAGFEFSMDSKMCDLEALKSLLVGKRDFMVQLLENPLLLEHETFTDLLWAVFHLTEELASRKELTNLGEPDHKHISVDMSRAYKLLTSEWLSYMIHLEKSYPYLFSLAIRLNPFDPDAKAEVC